MTTLYLEPFGGIAGDMLLAGLLDLDHDAFDLEALRRFAAALVPGEVRLARREVRRGAFRGSLLEVETPESAHPPPRHLCDLREILARSPLTEPSRRRAEAVLERLARAEARVHGSTIDEVHFHEVGAVDTLIDVGGALFALERLGIDTVRAAAPYVGGGTISGAHGTMPVPAPGTAEILTGVPVRHGAGGERVTPTGAALLVELAGELVGEIGAPFSFAATAIGYGAGSREPVEGPPNLLRVQLGEETAGGGGARRDDVWLLELNLDDVTGEEAGFLLGVLRRAGALEAWSVPVQMKKDRPGVVISALVREPLRDPLEAAAFAHSPTLGVRWTRLERRECPRETIEVRVDGLEGGAKVRVKVRGVPGTSEPGPYDVSPEYDDLARIARETGLPLREVEKRAVAAAWRRLRG